MKVKEPQAVRAFLRSTPLELMEDLHTNNACQRCSGFLVPETYFDTDNSLGGGWFQAWRCVQCGNFVDPIILHNRKGSKPEPNPEPAPTKR